MARFCKVKKGDVFFSNANGYYYEILGKDGQLWEVETWTDGEDGEIDPSTISTGHITRDELRHLLKDETGENYGIEWEDEEI